ncbi:MAG: bifunctional 5,10-methylenetetrahydrofolate dehydrogenase/5,10-methenyltetrahydrofolate cyclohydrolase [Candidatus Levybacteria bacterium]|nr:bifunctional 5,10-methylenetetrahydrofolate dehydrogenase/5,10-methenyltetrahydrofolate cyclohydrolase [Candidatus Levybacteria bacterium]
MKIDGKAIAQNILENLKKRVHHLKNDRVEPHLVIILVGDDPASHSYVKQKEKKSQAVGIKATIVYLQTTITQDKLLSIIEQYNNDKNIHGIIVQRPLPEHIDARSIDEAVDPVKDVDGFCSNSKFQMPLAKAVFTVLSYVHDTNIDTFSFEEWLRGKNIVVFGKGKTGGGPVIALLKKKDLKPFIVDSKTKDPENILKNADIVISAIGKPKILNTNALKKGVMLVGIGMFRGTDGKLHGDYEEDQVKNVASFYTPVPGGVGPVNVAMLLANVVEAAAKSVS